MLDQNFPWFVAGFRWPADLRITRVPDYPPELVHAVEDWEVLVELSKRGDVDGVVTQDRLGLEAVYVQAKRWEGVVGRPVVQAFVGSLEGFRARKGVMITTSKFTDEASRYVERLERSIVLIPGEKLAELLIEHGVGVIMEETFTLKRVDFDYFSQQ